MNSLHVTVLSPFEQGKDCLLVKNKQLHTPEELQYLACISSQVVVVVKNLLANTGDIRDANSVPGLGRSPGEEQGNPLQYSCLENPMDRGAWRATVHRVAKSWMRLKLLNLHMHSHFAV